MADKSKPQRKVSLPVDVVSEVETLLRSASKKKHLDADERRQLSKYASLLRLKLEKTSNGATQLSQKTCMAILRLLGWIIKNNSKLREVIDALLGKN